MQGRNRDTGIENGLVDAGQEGERVALPRIQGPYGKRTVGTAAEPRELSLALCADPEGWDWAEGGKEAQEKGADASI